MSRAAAGCLPAFEKEMGPAAARKLILERLDWIMAALEARGGTGGKGARPAGALESRAVRRADPGQL
jgi:hypothetical protein